LRNNGAINNKQRRKRKLWKDQVENERIIIRQQLFILGRRPDNFDDIIMKRTTKSRKLMNPNTATNNLETEELKRILLESKNGNTVKQTMKKKGFEFTKVHNMERTEIEGIEVFKMMEEKGCLPVLTDVLCPYCKVNYYEGDPVRIFNKMSEYMERTHLIRNKNQTLNILFNIYGNYWWMDFVYKLTTLDVNFHSEDIRYCKYPASKQSQSNKIPIMGTSHILIKDFH
jgi:hypothetical protein